MSISSGKSINLEILLSFLDNSKILVSLDDTSILLNLS